MSNDTKYYESKPSVSGRTVTWQETYGYVRMGRSHQGTASMYYGQINWRGVVKPNSPNLENITGRAQLSSSGNSDLALDLGDYDDLGEMIKLLQSLRSKLAYPGGEPTKPEEENSVATSTTVQLPRPGEKFTRHDIVLASTWLGDKDLRYRGLLLTMNPENDPTLRFVIRNISWSGHEWVTDEIKSYTNLMGAVEIYKSRGGILLT